MPIKDNREYRNFSAPVAVRKQNAGEETENQYIVEGYATTFDEYTIWSDSETVYKERVDQHAFDNTDMTDVIFLYDHEGMVFARSKTKTLTLEVDDHGLKVIADLSSTEDSKRMFENIKSGLVDQMSFAFTVSEDAYNKDTHTRTILKIGKVYDVSAVSIPANPGTDISAKSARSYVDGVIDAAKAERLDNEMRLALAKALYNYQTI